MCRLTASTFLLKITGPFLLNISDSAATVTTSLAGLETLALAHKISTITLTDAGIPNLGLTASLALANKDALVLIQGAYVAMPSTLNTVNNAVQGVLRHGVDSVVAARLANQLALGMTTQSDMATGLINQAQSSTVPALITFDFFFGSTPSSAGVDYLTNYDSRLATMGFSLINVWVNLGASFALNGQFGATYGSMTRDQFVDTTYPSIFGHMPSQQAHSVFASSMDFYASFAGSELGSCGTEVGIMLYLANLDPTNHHARALDSFLQNAAAGTPTYLTSLIGTYSASADSAGSLQADSRIVSFSVNDSSTNVAANLDALTGDSKLSSITLTDNIPLSVSSAQLSAGAAVLAKINGTYSLLVTGTPDADTVDLSHISAPATINLGGDTASVSAGLNAPGLAFVGKPDMASLGNAAATVQYELQAASGIEEIANFQYGLDTLDLDLLAAAAVQLVAFDTTVSGQHAIALASSSDLTHGIVLTGMVPGQTAADLIAHHLTFNNGHAIVA